MNQATLCYVRQHSDDDVRMLALRGCKDPDVDLPLALSQIQGRQTARRKLPSWAATDGIVYPPHLNMEQCSSEHTARYKADICRRLVGAGGPDTGQRQLLDLTGGFGVDFAFMQEAFTEATYVERNPQLCNTAGANFRVLGLRVTTVCADAADHLSTIGHVSMIYLDPARRDGSGARTYAISDCTPDAVALRDQLLARADHVMLKLSPMLDWRKAVSDMGADHVSEVHIVAVGGECKELLLVLQAKAAPLRLFCVNDDQSFCPGGDAFQPEQRPSAHPPLSLNGKFIFEPNAAIMAAGCFQALSDAYGVVPLAANSHLFAADGDVPAFPGRRFVVRAVSTLSKRDLRQHLSHLSQANITVRNFPLPASDLRRRLRLRDGGPVYILATTLADGQHVLLVTEKASSQE